MTEDKVTIPKFRGPKDNFLLWAARIEALLEEKEASSILTKSEELETFTEAEKKMAAKACSVIMRGLGDKPLAAVMKHKKHPMKIWNGLFERYASVDTFSRASVQTLLARIKYSGQKMDEFISEFENLAAKLDAMDASMDESLLITMFFESFGSKKESDFGSAIAALQTKEELTWQQVSSRMMQEYNSLHASAGGSGSSGASEQALPARETGDAGVTRKCFYCKKPGHFKKDCRKKKAADEERRKRQGNSGVHQDGALAVLETGQPKYALLDSGATSHMVRDRNLISHLSENSVSQVVIANNDTLDAQGAGPARLSLGMNKYPVSLPRVLHVPGLGHNLISISALCDTGLVVSFTADECRIMRDRKTVGRGQRNGGVYSVPLVAIENASVARVRVSEEDSLDIWHYRMGHADRRTLKRMATAGIVKGLDLKLDFEQKVCPPCVEGKMINGAMPSRTQLSRVPGEVIHSDICGPMHTMSIGGAKYYVTFLEEASGHVTAKSIKSKGEASGELLKYIKWIERQTGAVVKRVRSDGGGEYIGAAKHLEALGIESEFSAPYTPDENGRAERVNRTLVDVVRATLSHAGLPAEFWAECLQNAVKIRNLIAKSGRNATPLEMVSGNVPNVDYLRVFGCRAWVRVPDKKRKKLHPKSKKGVVTRCVSRGKYRVYLEEEHRFVQSRHCRVVETELPARKWKNNQPTPAHKTPFAWSPDDISYDTGASDDSDKYDSDADPSSTPGTIEEEGTGTTAEIDADAPRSYGAGSDTQGLARRNPPRVRNPPSRLLDGASVAVEEPLTYDEAMAGPDRHLWKEALDREMKSLAENRTWESAILPRERQALTCKFVFKKKFNADGSVSSYKVRLVCHGYKQRFGVDFGETYAPVADFETVLTIMSSLISNGSHVHQADIVTAFLYGTIDEEVYITLPRPFDEHGQHYKLRKSLYGLKQSPKIWFELLTDTLQEFGFDKFASADCVFIKNKGTNSAVTIIIYVDDLIIISKETTAIEAAKKSLSAKFKVKDLGRIHHFLGIKFEYCHDGRSMMLTQRSYLARVLERFGMSECKPADTPMQEGLCLAVNGAPESTEERREMEKIPYREVVGSLLYLATKTRPDICFPVGVLCRYIAAPRVHHWTAAKRVLRYLRGTMDMGIRIGNIDGERRSSLAAHSDSDWAGDRGDRRSTGGYFITYNGGCVSWRSFKQSCVSLSSTEAEYMALAACCKAVVRARSILTELGIALGCTTIYEDNQSCITWAEVGGKRTKHIDVQYHYTREMVARGIVQVVYCPTSEMPADVLTKALGRVKFVYLTKKLALGN